MSTFAPICLRCQVRQHVNAAPKTATALSRWPQGVRFASSQRRSSRLARMKLSSTVAQSSPRYGEAKKPSPRFHNSSFGGMNQTRVRLRENPKERRSQAERNRATSKEGKAKNKDKDGDEKPLFKALKMQETLSSISYERRNAIKSKLGNITSFDQFRLLPVVREALAKTVLPDMTELTPTAIQRLSISELLKRPPPKAKSAAQDEKDDGGLPQFDQYLLAAETGSGKTLGYLLPIVDAVKRADIAQKEADRIEEERKKQEQETKSQAPDRSVFELEPPKLSTPETMNVARPKAIILVPTSELVSQVGEVIKQLSHTVKFRSALLSSSYTPRRIRSNLFHPDGLDIVVTTPHLIASIAEANPYVFSRVTHLVVDEADSLFDRSFSPSTLKIIERTASKLEKLVLCSATIPKSLDNFVRDHFPQAKRLVTPNLHSIPRRVALGVVDVDKPPYRGNRDMACADAIWSIGKSGTSGEGDLTYQLTGVREPKNIVVFVNRRETAEEVAQYLKSKGIDAISLSGDMEEKRKAEIMSEFTIPKPAPSPEDIRMLQKPKFQEDLPFERANSKQSEFQPHHLQNTRVLVATDLGSRGIDTVAVKTVILYDVPHTSIDFIHRLGRVGRMNRRGRGVVLVGKKDRKDIVREIRDAMFRGQALI